MNRELVTVIVPVYMVKESLLRKSIESILKQTYSNIQLLVVNDGSPDDSGKICEEYAKNDSRMRVFHIENSGVSRARNYALEYVEGSYIMFVDSDDFIEPECIEILLNTINEWKADCAMCATYQVYEQNSVNRENHMVESGKRCKVLEKEESIFSLCYMEQPFDGYEFGAIWGTLYRTDLIKNVRFNTNMKIGEDFEFKLKVFLNAQKIVCVERKLYNYLIRCESAMRNGFDISKLDSVTELDNLIKYGFDNKEYLDGLKSRAVNIAIVILFMIPFEVEYKKYRKRIEEFICQYRLEVIKNSRTRKKVKFALLMSYLGFDLTQKIFMMLKNK